MSNRLRSLEEESLVDNVLSIAPGQDKLIGRDHFAEHCLRVGPSIGSITIIEEVLGDPGRQWLKYLGDAQSSGTEHKLLKVDTRGDRYRFLGIESYPEGVSFPRQN